ncbi:MAG: stage II sporulation protein M [Planctomycetota bacterium]
MNDVEQSPWSVRFRRERQRAWVELEHLVARCEKQGVDRLGSEKVARLPVLYRAALSSLGVARASVLDRSLLEYLESLVARAYLVVYAPKRSLWTVVGQFAARGFPQAVRSIRWQVLASGLLLVLGCGIAFSMVRSDPESFYLFVDAQMSAGRDPTASTEELRRTLFGANGHDDYLLTFATFLFTHNSSVGIMTYGLGFLFGLPVVLMLFYNGMVLGAMTAVFHSRDLAVEWWSWILPHGVTELLAITLCGAAGLAVGQHLVFPGAHGRLDQLAKIGRSMGAVVAGSVGMLLLAGMIEGVFRQTVDNLVVRYLLASTFAAMWIAYFSLAGRGRV